MFSGIGLCLCPIPDTKLLTEGLSIPGPHCHGIEKQAPLSLRGITECLTVMLNSVHFLSQQGEGGWSKKCIFFPTPQEKSFVEGVGWML